MPALGTRQPAVYTILDHSGETKTIRLYTGEITTVSIDGLLTELATFESALDAVILGVRSKQSWGAETVVTNTVPAALDAQVETELLVRVRGTATEAPWSFRIPAVDYTAFNYAEPPAGDQVILTGAGASAATTALKNAIEATFRMPDDDGETVDVVGMEVVR
jgi:hypothetical protein